MKDMSNALLALYEAAENASVHAFPREAVRLLHRLIRFDAAVLGIGELLTTDHSGPVTEYAWACEREASILEDYSRVCEHDPIARRFLNGLHAPICCDCSSLFRRARASAMEEFVQRYRLRHLMLFGSVSSQARPHWVVLYRSNCEPFTRRECEDLMLMWPHFERCIPLNRARHLDRQMRGREARAAALVNWHGYVEAADPCFQELIALEWPGARTDRMAPEVIERFRAGQDFEGLRICISLYLKDELIVCKAYEKDLLSTLTPAELAVAQEFSRGLTHKDVAQILGVSQHTVRSHIKHVYDKLAINSKARLAQMMAASQLR